MWTWLRSLWSGHKKSSPATFQATDTRAAPPPAHSVSSPPSPSRTPPQASPPPAPAKPLPGLDWKPLEIAAAEEPALAPALTGTAADENLILGIDLGTTHSVVAVV